MDANYSINYLCRRDARKNLGGNVFSRNWLFGALVMFIVGIIPGISSGIESYTEVLTKQQLAVPPYFLTMSLVVSLAGILLTGALSSGVANMFLQQNRTQGYLEADDALFGFKHYIDSLALHIISSIIIALWTLLLIVPGIVKSYSYAMIWYVKADHKHYSWRDCMDESKEIMYGHRFELFVLQLSFIGWYIVGLLCFGIGTLWVNAYREAAMAAFYERISSEGVGKIVEQEQ